MIYETDAVGIFKIRSYKTKNYLYPMINFHNPAILGKKSM